MTTTEKLFAQIFERKKRIVDQVKRQIDQFDHHLASICVLDGVAPPPWLLSLFSSDAPDFNEMRKEELISELLLQRSQTASSVLNCHYPLHQKPAVNAHNKGIPNASCTEVYASNCTNGGNGLSALHPSPTDDNRCTANGVPDLDGSVTSPPDCPDATQSDYCQNHSPSLLNIQRSKSRQRALELRNSAKANKRKSCEGNHVGASASQGTGSEVNPSQYDPVDDLPLANFVDANNEPFRQVLRSIDSAGKKMSCDIDSDRNVRPVSCSQKKTGCVDETGNDGNLSYIADSDGFNMSLDCPLPPPNCFIGLSDPSVFSKLGSKEEANLVESRGSKKNSMEFCNKAAESSTSISQVSTKKEPFEAGNTSCDAKVDDEGKNSLEQPMKVASSNSKASRFFKSSAVISNESYKERKVSVRDQEIKERDINIYVGRTTRSRSPHCQINVMNESLELEKSQISSKENGLVKTKLTLDPAFELLESGKRLDTTSVSCGVEARMRDSQKVDAETSARGCGATRSSSSSKKCHGFSKSQEKGVYNDVAKNGDRELLQSLGESSKSPKQTSVVGEGVKVPNPASVQPNFLSTSVRVTDENVADMYFNGMADNCQIASRITSTSARCGVESSRSMPPRDCAIVLKPQQIDFDNIEDSSLLKSFSLELENDQECITEKQHSPLLQALDEVSLHDSQKRPPIPIKIPLQKEDVSSKQEKGRKFSSEAILKDNANLVKKRTFSSTQQELGSFDSQGTGANFLFMGSWPQHKGMKIGSQLTDCLSPSLVLKPCPPSNKDHMGDALQSDAITSPVEGMGRDVEQQNLEQSEIYLSKLHDDEVASNLDLNGEGDALAPLLDQAATCVASLKSPAAGFSQDSLMDKPEAAYPNYTNSHVTRQNTAEDNQPWSQVSYEEDAIQETKYHFEGKKSLSHFSSSSPSNLSDVGTDQRMPEYEGFFMDSDTERPSNKNEEIDFEKLDHPSTALRMASVLDQLCKSTSLCTPLSHTTGYELHEAQNTCSSLPNGVLEGMELKNFHMNYNESKLLLSSYSCFNEGVIDDTCERTQSVSSLHNALSAWDVSKPCMSPVKVWDVMPPKSSSSSKRVSSIPELPCINEENENADGMADTILEDNCRQMKMSLVKREALADIRNNSNPPTSVCETKIQDDRFSVASVNTELGYSGACYRSKKKLMDHNRKKSVSKDKENQNISLGGDGAKRSKGPPHSRFSKPKLSDKLGKRNGGPRLSEKEPKRNNIVSNITSFVPLVQQKQAAAVVTGKRDIKVKALEAAEAAKRLADKKENERKMKKEALKIERAKMEEANQRQLELERRKKEEERKKKDADMAAKKRQREEEERKERERKRMRVEEAKKNHQDNEKNLQKESKFKAANERAHNKKESKKMEKPSVKNNHQTVPVIKAATFEVSTNAIIYANNSVEYHEALSRDSSKVTGKPSENYRLVSNVNEEQSYDVSPYKDSDNEDEDEEEENRRNKYRPSWASKTQLALAVSAQQKLDAKLLFPPERCPDTWKVLLPRKLQRIS